MEPEKQSSSALPLSALKKPIKSCLKETSSSQQPPISSLSSPMKNSKFPSATQSATQSPASLSGFNMSMSQPETFGTSLDKENQAQYSFTKSSVVKSSVSNNNASAQRRVSFMSTAKVRNVPLKSRRKSSLAPFGGFGTNNSEFQIPDLSSDKRRSGSLYGVLGSNGVIGELAETSEEHTQGISSEVSQNQPMKTSLDFLGNENDSNDFEEDDMQNQSSFEVPIKGGDEDFDDNLEGNKIVDPKALINVSSVDQTPAGNTIDEIPRNSKVETPADDTNIEDGSFASPTGSDIDWIQRGFDDLGSGNAAQIVDNDMSSSDINYNTSSMNTPLKNGGNLFGMQSNATITSNASGTNLLDGLNQTDLTMRSVESIDAHTTTNTTSTEVKDEKFQQSVTPSRESVLPVSVSVTPNSSSKQRIASPMANENNSATKSSKISGGRKSIARGRKSVGGWGGDMELTMGEIDSEEIGSDGMSLGGIGDDTVMDITGVSSSNLESEQNTVTISNHRQSIGNLGRKSSRYSIGSILGEVGRFSVGFSAVERDNSESTGSVSSPKWESQFQRQDDKDSEQTIRVSSIGLNQAQSASRMSTGSNLGLQDMEFTQLQHQISHDLSELDSQDTGIEDSETVSKTPLQKASPKSAPVTCLKDNTAKISNSSQNDLITPNTKFAASSARYSVGGAGIRSSPRLLNLKKRLGMETAVSSTDSAKIQSPSTTKSPAKTPSKSAASSLEVTPLSNSSKKSRRSSRSGSARAVSMNDKGSPTTSTLSPLHRKVLGVKREGSPLRRSPRRKSSNVGHNSAYAGTPLKNVAYNDEEKNVADESFGELEEVAENAEKVTEEMDQAANESFSSIAHIDSISDLMNQCQLNLDINLKELKNTESALFSTDDNGVRFVLDINNEVSVSYFEKMNAELKYMIEQEQNAVSQLEKQIDDNVAILIQAHMDLEPEYDGIKTGRTELFKNVLRVAEKQADVMCKVEWYDWLLSISSPFVQTLLDNVAKNENVPSMYEEIKKHVDQMNETLKDEYHRVSEYHSKVLDRKAMFSPEEEQILRDLENRQKSCSLKMSEYENYLRPLIDEVEKIDEKTRELLETRSKMKEEKGHLAEAFVHVAQEDGKLPYSRMHYELMKKAWLWDVDGIKMNGNQIRDLKLIYRGRIQIQWQDRKLKMSAVGLNNDEDMSQSKQNPFDVGTDGKILNPLPTYFQFLCKLIPRWFQFDTLNDLKRLTDLMEYYSWIYEQKIRPLMTKYPCQCETTPSPNGQMDLKLTFMVPTVSCENTKSSTRKSLGGGMKKLVWTMNGLSCKLETAKY